MKKGGAASAHTQFSLKSLERTLETSKKKRDDDASTALGCSLKRDKKTVETSTEKKTFSDGTASADLPSKWLSTSLEVQKEANDSVASDSSEEDNLTIAELLKSRKKHDGFLNEHDNISGNDIRERPGLHLEEWVIRLERIVAKLKAERLGHKSQG